MEARNLLKLVLGCTLLIGCANNSKEQPETEPTVKVSDNKPDSVYVYHISANGTETRYKMIYYTYDAIGNITCELDSFMETTIDIRKEKQEIKYNSKGCITEYREYVMYTYTDWIYESCTQYLYNENNSTSMILLYLSPKEPVEEGYPSEKFTYTWTDDRHAECMEYTYDRKNEDDPWRATLRIEYTFGKEYERAQYYSPENNSLLYTSEFEYKFDQYGNLVSKERYVDEVFRNGEYYSYEYDANGTILSKLETQYGNNKYSTKYVYFY